MNRKFSIILLLSATATLLTTLVQAKNVTVYRWVDENNVVHYGQHEPLEDDFSEITVETTYSPVQAPLKENVSAEAKQKLLNSQVARASNIKCKNAEANLRTLNDFAKIEVTEENGKSRLLTDVERIQRISQSEKEVEAYCK
ncbi:DUF4124 domain-containing protein [Thalassotalea psychrophila]|uniref:DUF4124 domain-containing protein n=1 Tax=Thalassotalea psychrophila TaxID=3065647 RepID=A0ABY9TXS2_9GAMM|nr:DUF4124 domain-containing protein [Colwelliaceae bacterium SQ149]